MDPLENQTVIREASFNRKVRTYWLLQGALILTFSIVGIVLLPLWFIIGNFFTERYLRRMRCVLTARALHVRKGLFVRLEKTVPLDKITDLGMVQGPVMRWLGLEAVSIETAGQSAQGALIRLVGIEDAQEFRGAVLEQRDRVMADLAGLKAPAERPTLAGSERELLTDIRDSLRRIEQRMGNKA